MTGLEGLSTSSRGMRLMTVGAAMDEIGLSLFSRQKKCRGWNPAPVPSPDATFDIPNRASCKWTRRQFPARPCVQYHSSAVLSTTSKATVASMAAGRNNGRAIMLRASAAITAPKA